MTNDFLHRYLAVMVTIIAVMLLSYGCIRQSQRPMFNTWAECVTLLTQDGDSLETIAANHDFCSDPNNVRNPKP